MQHMPLLVGRLQDIHLEKDSPKNFQTLNVCKHWASKYGIEGISVESSLKPAGGDSDIFSGLFKMDHRGGSFVRVGFGKQCK